MSTPRGYRVPLTPEISEAIEAWVNTQYPAPSKAAAANFLIELGLQTLKTASGHNWVKVWLRNRVRDILEKNTNS